MRIIDIILLIFGVGVIIYFFRMFFSDKMNLVYRKAEKSDIDQIVKIVTDNIGTSNILKSSTANSRIIEKQNKYEIESDIDGYCVCESNGEIVGVCGISKKQNIQRYGRSFNGYRDILYLAVAEQYRGNGIATKLLGMCCDGVTDGILYEAWGDGDKVNAYKVLKRNSFKFMEDLGDTYYKDNGYCPYCINREKGCVKCKAEIWLKNVFIRY
ncbi:MAG: GNAT family N-acetyltransferase [Alphaproteobacteria bacterium]|nr:GNAT family N-acetyltransferase [Alphaproteobacteria bacterium]